MSNYIWNNTYSIEFLSEDFYDLNISTKDNVYETIRKKKDGNEVASLSINISNHICMFVQLLDNIIGRLSYNNNIINDKLNYKKLCNVFSYIKTQLYNCDYSLFLRIYSIYHNYNHRKNGYLDVNNLYSFILDIINKIENLNENNFLILPGGFYLQKEKMLIKILYIIHRENNLYSFSVLNNSIYGIQYHPFKIDEVDNLGVLLRDVVVCIKNISKNYLTNSLFWLCLYRLYIFPNPDNVDILYQILLPYLNNSFLMNNWNICNNKTIKIADEKNDMVKKTSSLYRNDNNSSFFNIYNDLSNLNDGIGSFEKIQTERKLANSNYNGYFENINSFENINTTNMGVSQGFNDPFNLGLSGNYDNNNINSNNNNSFFMNNNNNMNENRDNLWMNNEMNDNKYINNNINNDIKNSNRNDNDKYGGIYVNIYKNKFTSFSMSLYYCIIYMLKILNIQKEDIEIFKIFIYYSIILKLCDDLYKYEKIEKSKEEMSNFKEGKDEGNSILSTTNIGTNNNGYNYAYENSNFDNGNFGQNQNILQNQYNSRN
ncbi:homeobox-containing protein, partial [Plasmodium yoelii yoelii]